MQRKDLRKMERLLKKGRRAPVLCPNIVPGLGTHASVLPVQHFVALWRCSEPGENVPDVPHVPHVPHAQHANDVVVQRRRAGLKLCVKELKKQITIVQNKYVDLDYLQQIIEEGNDPLMLWLRGVILIWLKPIAKPVGITTAMALGIQQASRILV